MRTAGEIITAALDELALYTDRLPGSRTAMLARINARQQQLFQLAAAANPEYYGVCATGDVIQGAADLALLDGGAGAPHAIERLQKVVIADPGSSGFPVGAEVSIVGVEDTEGPLPPRATVRDNVLRGVGAELDEVAKLRVSYSRHPSPVAALEDPHEIRGGHAILLVYDLVRYGLRRAELEPGRLEAALKIVADEEAPALEAFLAHVRAYTPDHSRF